MTKIKKGFADEQMEKVKHNKSELDELYITQLNKLYDKSQKLEHQLLISRLLTVLITSGLILLLPMLIPLLKGASNSEVGQFTNIVVTLIYILTMIISILFMLSSMTDVLAIYMPIVRYKLLYNDNTRLVSLELREIFKLQSMVEKYIDEEINNMRKDKE